MALNPQFNSRLKSEAWQKAFRITDETCRQWDQSAGDKCSTLLWALKNHKIDSKKYMAWALDHYQIPVLSNSFFQNIQITHSLLKKSACKNIKSEEGVPFYEWDDVIFMACAAPPPTPPPGVVPVLASYEQLEWCRQKINKLSQDSGLKPVKAPSPKASEANLKVKEPAEGAGGHSHHLESQAAPEAKPTIITKLTRLFSKTSPSIHKEVEIDSVCASVIQNTKDLYSSAIVFLYKDLQFVPIEWSSSLESSAEPVDTRQSSIFKIVRRSLKPYHGFVVENKIHRDFFTHWGFKDIPQHITLLPVFAPYSNKQLIGAFMGMAEASIHPAKITQALAWCKPLSKALQTAVKSKAG